MNRSLLLSLLALCLLFVSGCALSAAEIEGDSPGECDDGTDNDQDGAADCDDDGCAADAACAGDDDDTAGDDDDTAGDDDDTAGDDDDSAAGDDDDSAGGDDDDATVTLDAPTVEGELSAGHYRPTWLWSVPTGASQFRYRVDNGAWTEVASSVTHYSSATDLSAGAHSFEVQAGDGSGSNWSASGSFSTTIEIFSANGYRWEGVERIMATSPQGEAAAVSCHNCYEDGESTPALNMSATLSAIDAAVAAGADLIELDIKVQGADWLVGHDDDGSTSGANLADVLASPSLTDIDQPLFIEIKETSPAVTDLEALIYLLTDAGYMTNGRPVVLRTFNGRIANLTYAKTAIDSGDFPLHENYVRYSVLYDSNEESNMGDFQTLLTNAQALGYHMVEFNRSTPNLFGLLTWAQELDLLTGVWTVPASMGEVFCAFFRNEVDVITTDYPVDSCRTVIEDDNSLLYLNVWSYGNGTNSVASYRADDTPYPLSVGGTNQPALVPSPQGEDLYGGYLDFNAAESDHLSTWDADNNASEGYFAGLVVNFDEFQLASGETGALLNKSDSGGFAFEVVGSGGGQLRFGVHAAGDYHYATYPVSSLNGTDSYYLIGAYDGDGAVRLWVNGSTSGTTSSSSMTAGVTQNNSPVVIGADPQGASATRYYGDNKIQMVTLQKWANH